MSRRSHHWDSEPDTDTDIAEYIQSLHDATGRGEGAVWWTGNDARLELDIATRYAQRQAQHPGWQTGEDLPARIDQGDSPRGRALLTLLGLVVVVMVVVTGISHLRGW